MNKAYQDVKDFMQLGQPDMVSSVLRSPMVESGGKRSRNIGGILVAAAEGYRTEASLLEKDQPKGTLLGLGLMLEELGETVQAAISGDLAEFADGLADLVYVATWTAIAHGIDLPAVWVEVQRSNLSKFPECGVCSGRGRNVVDRTADDFPVTFLWTPCSACSGLGRVVIRDASGKIQKPPGWTPPDIKGVLARQ